MKREDTSSPISPGVLNIKDDWSRAEYVVMKFCTTTLLE